MDRIRFETHKGKQIFIEDFTQLKPGQEFLSLIREAQSVIAAQSPKSLLALFDASGATFNNENLNAMKEFSKSNTPYIKASAVVGITGLLQLALTAISKFSGRDFVSFKTREEAIDWLLKQ